jgi:hypothetical protein
MPLTVEDRFKRDLRFLGVASKPTDGQLLSPADIVIKRVQETKYVNYEGALSGKQCGFYAENGVRFLVTSEPQIIQPEPGSFCNIDAVITNLLAGKQEPYASDQSHCFYGWLQRAYCALRDRKFAPGQALTLAGPVEIGKSLLQNLITKILGGRCAKPALFLHSRRFGVRAFHHPVLLTELEELSPAIALLGLIDTAHIWEVKSDLWTGTALQLRALLLTHHKTARDADRLLGWTNACGQYLGDLTKIRPHRVKKTVKVSNIQHFEIWSEASDNS